MLAGRKCLAGLFLRVEFWVRGGSRAGSDFARNDWNMVKEIYVRKICDCKIPVCKIYVRKILWLYDCSRSAGFII
jgi:hypothetical protein